MSNRKILLVDDEQDILDLIGYNLEKEGFEVHMANNGREAIDIALRVVPDLILLDVMMPEMDGMETCMEMRERSQLDNSMIAFLTARGEDYSQIAGFDAGADDYINKPIKVDELSVILEKLERKVPNVLRVPADMETNVR